MLICGLVIASVIALFSVPWYVLGFVLAVTLLLIWRLMPNADGHLPETAIQSNHTQTLINASGATSVQQGSTPERKEPELLYRGAHYANSATTPPASPPATLSYRGANYSVEGQSPDQVNPAAAQPTTAPELKYRGAKVPPKSPS